MFEPDVRRIDYEGYSNRQLVAVPLVVLGLALLVLVTWSLFVTGSPAQPGSPVSMGIDFTGGTELTLETTASAAEIEAAFDTTPASIQRVQGSADRFIVTFQSGDGDALVGQAEELPLLQGNERVVQAQQSTTAAFAEDLQWLAVLGVVVAFAGMSVIAFVLFRTFVPSVAIVVSAFGDIVVPVALMDVLGMRLSLGVVAALLMLIGYSVDSDILLNNHILRRSGGFYESAYRAMRTGVTMTLTSISAMTVMAVVAYLFRIDLLVSIGIVLVFGLVTDLLNTYLLNMSLLRWYVGLDGGDG